MLEQRQETEAERRWDLELLLHQPKLEKVKGAAPAGERVLRAVLEPQNQGSAAGPPNPGLGSYMNQ